jgi:hydroxyacylglutathione hydrolase
MRLERIYTPGLAQVAYLVGDEQAGVAAVIDPRRDVQVYVDIATAAGLRITHVLETHVHADFVSGAPELARATGATVYASRLGESAFPHQPVDDGDILEVGRLRLRALWTPGHTPEHISWLLTDTAAGDEPQVLFSGDMLFVGEVGRPDLLGEEQTDTLVDQLYDSIHERLMPLDDALIVYAGHGAGSACGKSIGDAPSTTLGQEKRFNYAFRPMSRAQFKQTILAGMPPAPTYYPVLKKINKYGADPLDQLPPGGPLPVDEVKQAVANGALLIDTRSPAAFGGAHIPRSIFAGLGPSFSAWMGWLAPYGSDLVLLLEADTDYDEALTELRRIGLDRVSGYVQGGLGAWLAAGEQIDTLPQVSVHDLHERIEDLDTLVLDVRGADEWEMGHISGAKHRYAGLIASGRVEISGLLERGPLAVICGSGYRSSVVASLLKRAGRQDLVNVIGGMSAWQAAGFKTVDD